LSDVLSAAGPPLLFGLRLWASVCLALYVAFWLQLDNAYWAGTSAAIVCQPQLGASLRKGWFRLVGTLIGAVAIVVLTALFPQDRMAFLSAMALWGAACALVATLLRNFAAYAAALAGYTAAIIASDQLGAAGGLNGEAFMLAVARASEICIGIVSAGVVLAGTDLGTAPRRLAQRLASLSAEIAGRFCGALLRPGHSVLETQPERRELTRQAIALDPVIDEAIGESSALRYHSPILQAAVDGLLAAVSGWRAVAWCLAYLPDGKARCEAGAIIRHVPREIQSAMSHGEVARWMADPVGIERTCEAGAQALIALPADSPSLRLLADQTAKILTGMAQALNALALLVGAPTSSTSRARRFRLTVPDWLPAFANAGRAFVVIGCMELFWIVTAWPSGATAITFAAIVVILLAPRADQAYAAATSFSIGTGLATVFAAVIAFAVLPGVETFEGFCIVIALYLVPSGAMTVQSWQTPMFVAMTANFIPLLAPANPMSYDPAQFFNAALAIATGSIVAATSFRLLPPLSPAVRARRLLALTLRDLHRLAAGAVPATTDHWESRTFGRLAVLPDRADPLQRAQLVAALSVGSEVIRLRQRGADLALDRELDTALQALVQGNVAIAIARLEMLDHRLAARAGDGPAAPDILRARGSILVISEALAQHPSYFGAGAGR